MPPDRLGDAGLYDATTALPRNRKQANACKRAAPLRATGLIQGRRLQGSLGSNNAATNQTQVKRMRPKTGEQTCNKRVPKGVGFARTKGPTNGSDKSKGLSVHLLQSTNNRGLGRSRGNHRQVISKRTRNGSRNRVANMLQPNAQDCIETEKG